MLATLSRRTRLGGALGLLRREPLLRDAVLVAAGSALIALSAQVSIALPIGPVPITGQTFAVQLLCVYCCGTCAVEDYNGSCHDKHV